MKQKAYHKCSVEKGFCETLDMVVQPGSSHSKGFEWYVILPNLEELLQRKQFSLEKEAKTIGVVYKRTGKDKGIMLNFCPFCGESLRPFRKGYTKE